MPTVGTLEYLWCTMAKKSGLSDKKVFDIPVQQGETTLLDITGHGVSGALKMVLPLCKTVADMPLILATMRSVRLIGIFRLVKVSRSVLDENGSDAHTVDAERLQWQGLCGEEHNRVKEHLVSCCLAFQ